VSLDSVLRDFFGRRFTDFDELVSNGPESFESAECVIALGTYSSVSEEPAEGSLLVSRTCGHCKTG
jgi:hypothetical protein